MTRLATADRLTIAAGTPGPALMERVGAAVAEAVTRHAAAPARVLILAGPGNVDRTMAAQLLGTGGIAALLLVAAATGVRGAEDVALGLALLAAFASVAFVNSAAPEEDRDAERVNE